MADTFKATSVESLTLGRASAAPTEAVRRDELDSELAAKADTSQVAADIAASVHAAVTVTDTPSIDITVDGNQVVSAVVKLATAVEEQAGETGRTQFFVHPVAAQAVLQADRVSLTSLVVTRVLTAESTLIATGVLGTDYSADLLLGRVTILTGNLTTSAGQSVKLLFNCAQLLSGPGVGISAGVTADFGTAHHQVARGDHRHTNDHKPAASASTLSGVTTVDSEQRVKVDVRLDGAGGLVINANGVAANFSVIAAANHSHSNASGGAAGFMSAADYTLLHGISTTAISVLSSQNLNLAINAGQITGNVIVGFGLQLTANGVEVNTAQVATASHKHLAVMAVNSVVMDTGGTGYQNGATISFTGGAAGGHGATATATIVAGVITAITIIEPGYRYRSGNLPTVVITPVSGGSGATAHAVVNEADGWLSATAAADILALL